MKQNDTKQFSWVREGIGIRGTLSLGKAAVTLTNIKKGELVMVFGGYVMSIDDENNLPETIKDLSLQITPELVIGIKNKNEISVSDYVNHSCDPNCGIKGQLSLVALRDISVGEDITFDYGTVLFSNMGGVNVKYEFECVCGAENCRRKVTDEDWKLKDLQLKYMGYFPYYIQEEIDQIVNM